MLNIVKVQPTVGKPIIYAVVSNDKNYLDLHSHLVDFLEDQFGRHSYMSYVESFAVSDVDVSSFKIDRILNIDDIVENKRVKSLITGK